jgi:hypothetical protein
MTYDEALDELAEHLAYHPLRDKIHQEVMADLYDRVNAIRDDKIKNVRALIKQHQESSDFWQSVEKQAKVINLQTYIDEMEGN